MANFIQILDIIIWPTVVLVGLLLFKREIGKVLKRLTKLETSAGSLHFKDDLLNVDRSLPDSPETKESKTWISEMEEIAKVSPRAAVLESWTSIELACIEKGLVDGSAIVRFSPKEMERYFYENTDADSELLNNLKTLRQLRNRVSHGRDIDVSYQDASKYIRVADKALNALTSPKVKK